MSILAKQLEQIANLRRQELLPFIYDRTAGKVQTGPFAGMIILPQFSWGDGDTASKLLGVYEDELHSTIHDAVKQKPDMFINIGCAEGYYAIGASRLLSHIPGVAVDINPNAVKITMENAMANNLRNMEFLELTATSSWLETKIKLTERPWLIVDCESYETELLDIAQAPSLRKAIILVECHDCMVPGITETLTKRFKNTHNIQAIKQQFKDPYKFDFLDEVSDCDKWALVHEGRPSTMTWLYMVPNQ
jgi:predicted RNA methylase